MTYFFRIAAGAIALTIIIGTMFHFFKSASESVTPEEAPKVTLNIIHDHVYRVEANGIKKLLATGATIEEGITIATDGTGDAEILFPSGSIARLDASTTVTLDQQFFDNDSGASKTGIFLSIGRVWSRVARLATPESNWEVKTSNVVAAVRGTAFNVGFTKDKKSRVLVDKDTVTLTAIDPVSKMILGTTTIPEKKFLELDSKNPRVTPKALEAQEPPAGFVDDAWIKRNQERDIEEKARIEARENELQQKAKKFEEKKKAPDITGKEETDAKAKEVKSTLPEKELEGTKSTVGNEERSSILPTKSDALETFSAPNIHQENSGESNSTAQPTTNKPLRLSIETQVKQAAYFEGTTVSFTAFLVFDDGRKQDVTKIVHWTLGGPVGTINREGVLTAQITDPVTAEFGKAEGIVHASGEFSGLRLEDEKSVIILTPPEDIPDNSQG